MVMKISVSIDVSDIKQAETFYVEALGCTKVRDQEPNMVVLSVENSEIYLQEKAQETHPLPSKTAVRDYARHWTPIHLDFLCDNIDERVSEIIKFGGVHEGGESAEWGTIAYCVDPFGNGFCLIHE